MEKNILAHRRVACLYRRRVMRQQSDSDVISVCWMRLFSHRTDAATAVVVRLRTRCHAIPISIHRIWHDDTGGLTKFTINNAICLSSPTSLAFEWGKVKETKKTKYFRHVRRGWRVRGVVCAAILQAEENSSDAYATHSHPKAVESNTDAREERKINTKNVERTHTRTPSRLRMCVLVGVSERKHVILWKLHLWELHILIRAALASSGLRTQGRRTQHLSKDTAWRVYKLLFYVREANVKIRYFCLCRHRSRVACSAARRPRHQQQYIAFWLHHSSHRINEYSTINPVPFSHIPAYIATVAYSNKIKTIQFAPERIFRYIKVRQSAISQLLPSPSPHALIVEWIWARFLRTVWTLTKLLPS